VPWGAWVGVQAGGDGLGLPGRPEGWEFPGHRRLYNEGYHEDNHDGQDDIYKVFLLRHIVTFSGCGGGVRPCPETGGRKKYLPV